MTAAHCIQNKHTSDRLTPSNVTLIFGAYDLNDLSQMGTFSTSPSEIIIHPDWNTATHNFDADIAIMITANTIPYTRYIKPICIWDYSNDAKVSDGYVSGWGKSSLWSVGYEPIPKMIKIPVKEQEDCFLESPIFAEMSSKRTFCGGAKDGRGPCLGKIFLDFIEFHG